VRAAATLALAMIALLLGGCAEAATAPVSATHRVSAELRRVQTTHELPTPAAPEHAPGSDTPVQAIRRFAERYVNWDAADVTARMRALATASVGQARSEMALTAAQVHADRTLSQAGIANRGTVEAVARLPRRRNRYVVVTRERTTATYSTAYQGLAPAWHVTLVTVVRGGAARPGGGIGLGRWVVSVWQPQS